MTQHGRNPVTLKKSMRLSVAVVALVIAIAHAFYVRLAVNVFSMYFIVSTVLFLVGTCLVFVGGEKWFRATAAGILVLSIADNLLILLTRSVALTFVGINRTLPWSTAWIPPGAVQVFIGQTLLIILCALALFRVKR